MKTILAAVVLALTATAALALPASPTIDHIRSLSATKVAGHCTTTCQWIGQQQICNTHCF